jgi:hypothetical protein
MTFTPRTFLTAIAALLVLITGTSQATTTHKPNAPAAPNVVDVNAGQLDIAIDPIFSVAMLSQGIGPSFHGTSDAVPPTSPRGSRGFRVYGGEVDTNSGEGEFETVGNLQFANSTTTVILRHLTLDTSGAIPVITAEVLVNNAITGRVPVFSLVVNDLFPVPPTGTTITTPTVAMVVNDSFVTLFNSIFGAKALWLGISAGTASVSATTGTIP